MTAADYAVRGSFIGAIYMQVRFGIFVGWQLWSGGVLIRVTQVHPCAIEE